MDGHRDCAASTADHRSPEWRAEHAELHRCGLGVTRSRNALTRCTRDRRAGGVSLVTMPRDALTWRARSRRNGGWLVGRHRRVGGHRRISG